MRKVEREAGKSILEAVTAAERLRLRAFMMTVASFIFGVVPLVIATGAGAASRHETSHEVKPQPVECEYHVVFIPTYRKKAIFGRIPFAKNVHHLGWYLGNVDEYVWMVLPNPQLPLTNNEAERASAIGSSPAGSAAARAPSKAAELSPCWTV